MNIDKDIERCKELIKTEHSNWIGMSNQDAIENLLSELETYKKIAEKLAEEMMKLPEGNYYYENKEGWLDWARKEVEKDD